MKDVRDRDDDRERDRDRDRENGTNGDDRKGNYFTAPMITATTDARHRSRVSAARGP